jgi:hypothetical protein
MWAFEDAALGSAAIGSVAAEADPDAASVAPPPPASGATTPVAAHRTPMLLSEDAGRDADARAVLPGERPSAATPQPPSAAGGGEESAPAVSQPAATAGHAGSEDERLLGEALALFNATEGPRRIAGVARSLGAPSVTVRRVDGSSAENSDALSGSSQASGGVRVAIVAAWELCWYRWEVDLNGVAVDAPLVAQGAELDELPAADLAGNAAVDKRGAVRLP